MDNLSRVIAFLARTGLGQLHQSISSFCFLSTCRRLQEIFCALICSSSSMQAGSMKTRTSLRLAWAAGSFTFFAARLRSLPRPKYEESGDPRVDPRYCCRVADHSGCASLVFGLSLRHKSHCARLVRCRLTIYCDCVDFSQKLLPHDNLVGMAWSIILPNDSPNRLFCCTYP